jgi:uncharacterized protein YecE (DUF72 family)
MTVYIGTSGWQYRHWRGTFYPEKLAQARWLEFYAERFVTAELNNSFYRLPAPETFATWAERTPDDFVMVVKASRYLSHIKRLREPEEPVRRFVAAAERLGGKLGPVLIQLPPDFQAALDRLTATLRQFPAGWRLAVEFRHDSWFTDEVREILTAHGAALCLADRRGPVSPLWRTAPFTYLRFHVGRATPEPCYGEQALDTWAHRLLDLTGAHDAWVFFNNDPRACALRDAIRFARFVRRLGVETTRVPESDEVHVAG